MPSTSNKQRKLMAAAANNPGFAEKVGIPRPVAEDFHGAGKGTETETEKEKKKKKKKKRVSPTMIAALTSENKGYA